MKKRDVFTSVRIFSNNYYLLILDITIKKRQMDNQFVIVLVMVTYISLLITWGIFQGRKVKTESDFAIAGRKLPG